MSATPLNASEMVVVLSLGDGTGGARLLARVTRRSWDHLQLATGQQVIAQVKGVALAPGRGDRSRAPSRSPTT